MTETPPTDRQLQEALTLILSRVKILGRAVM